MVGGFYTRRLEARFLDSPEGVTAWDEGLRGRIPGMATLSIAAQGTVNLLVLYWPS